MRLNLKGHVFVTIEEDGKKEIIDFPNQILRTGRYAVASALANSFSGSFDLYVGSMVFGTNGNVGGVPKEVEDTRTGLFGAVLLTKPIIASINEDLPSQVTFTSVMSFTEGNGSAISEMALVLSNDDYFSMASSGDISKTSTRQLTFNWRITLF